MVARASRSAVRAYVSRHVGARSRYSNAGAALRKDLDSVRAKLTAELNRAAGHLGLASGKSMKLESSDQIGFYLRITRKVRVAGRLGRSCVHLSGHSH